MKCIPSGCEPQEVPGAAPRLEHRGVVGDAEAFQRLEHRRDDRGRGVEGVEDGASGTRVLILGEEGRELLAQALPGRALVLAGHRVGEDAKGQGPKPGEAGEGRSLVGSREGGARPRGA